MTSIDLEIGIQTGYFADPKTKRYTKVHAVINRKPICNSKISPNKIFRWCSNSHINTYINCEKCIEILDKSIELYY